MRAPSLPFADQSNLESSCALGVTPNDGDPYRGSNACQGRASQIPDALPGARLIPLTRGLFAIVDPEDYAFLSEQRWHAKTTARGASYAGRHTAGQRILMHREVMPPPPAMWIDHINRNGLDNRRVNLRFCTPTQNNWNSGLRRNNTSGFKGVRQQPSGRFFASITASGGRYFLGSYATATEAAAAYDAAASKLHGEFAVLNFPNHDANVDESRCAGRVRIPARGFPE